jgi:hypothetical protein
VRGGISWFSRGQTRLQVAGAVGDDRENGRQGLGRGWGACPEGGREVAANMSPQCVGPPLMAAAFRASTVWRSPTQQPTKANLGVAHPTREDAGAVAVTA